MSIGKVLSTSSLCTARQQARWPLRSAQSLAPRPAWIWALIGLATVLAFVVLELISIHAGYRDYDEGVYWLTLRAMARGDHLYATIFASEPPVFFYTLLPFAAFGKTIAAIRLGVLVVSLVGLAAAYVAGRCLGGPAGGTAAVVLSATSPFYFDQSAILQSDAPSAALAYAAVALALLAARASTRRPVPLAAAASGLVLALAVGTKLSAVLAALPVLLILLTSARGRTVTTSAAVAGGLAGTVLVLLPIAGSWQAAYHQLVISHTGAAQALRRPLGANLALLLTHRGLPLMGIAGVAVLAAVWRRDRRIVIPALWALLTMLAILLYQPLFPHHLVQLVPPLSLTAAVSLSGLPWPGRPAWLSATAGLALLLVVSGYGLLVAVRHTQANLRTGAREAALAAALRNASRPGDFVISDNQYVVALADRDIPPQVLDTSRQVVAAGLLRLSQLQAAGQRYDVRLLLVDGDRLRGVPGFSAWLADEFVLQTSLGPQTGIYVRRSP